MPKTVPTPSVRALALVLSLSLPATGTAAASAAPSRPSPRATVSRPSPRATASASSARYLALAEAGVRLAESRFRDHRRGWYDARLDDRDRYPLATIWDIVPLFETVDAIATANPTPSNRRSVARFASGAERYLNRGLRPTPGFSPYPGDREPGTLTWFDDNGWWGIAFVNAFKATGSGRYLRDAERALRFIASAGWDPVGGGIWWNTAHPYKAGEALASGTLLAVLLYGETRSPFALRQARRFLAWANGPGFSAADGLYAGSNVSPTPIDYIEGPLIYAQALLCRLTQTNPECERAEALKSVALARFGYLLDFSPQYDAIYLQWMLALYGLDHDRVLYQLASDNARDARTRALSPGGLFLRSWFGQRLPLQYARPGMLQTEAATLSLFAWLAVYRPPSS